MELQAVALVMCVLSCVEPLLGYPDGAPDSACKNMAPEHEAYPQGGASPYTITPSANSYTAGSSVTVTIAGDKFEGFLIQARSSSTKAPVGSFTAVAGTTKQLCGNTALTQSKETEGNTITLTWNAPSSGQGDVKFFTTVVKSEKVYWVAMESSIVTGPGTAPQPGKPSPRPSPGPGTGSSPGPGPGPRNGTTPVPGDGTSAGHTVHSVSLTSAVVLVLSMVLVRLG